MNDETTPPHSPATRGEYRGWRVIITGGSSGIGLATGLRFLERGANVVSLDLKRPFDEKGISWQYCDVADDSAVRNAVTAAVEELGGLDVLINSAGVGLQGTVDESPELAEAQWRRLFEVNVLGVMRVTRAALPALRHSSRASIVNIASLSP
jgi:NAD(P)-dependent dehydrogenase (short-subunit alcohol dehydrogenase family)